MVRVSANMESRTDNTIVVIPSYNEARTIGVIVRTIAAMDMSVLVIDDGSIDATERVALDNGAMVLRHKRNLGKGFSIRQGIKYVLEKTNFKWMIMMDGDGQHHPEDIPILMAATQSKDVDVVTGNRMQQTKEMPVIRCWTNRFMSFVISGICRQRIPDTQCGYRLTKVDALKRIKLLSEKYDIESEILIEAARKGFKIKSVPIQTIYGQETSAIKPVRDAVRFFTLIFKHYLNPNELRRTKKKNG